MRYFVLLVLFFSLGLSACGGSQNNGTLTGGVTIGPIVPIDMGDGGEVPPESKAYLTRTIIVRDGAGNEADRMELQIPGRYEFSLEPGSYSLEISLIGIEASENSPAQLAVVGGQTTEHNIFIDTGIR